MSTTTPSPSSYFLGSVGIPHAVVAGGVFVILGIGFQVTALLFRGCVFDFDKSDWAPAHVQSVRGVL